MRALPFIFVNPYLSFALGVIVGVVATVLILRKKKPSPQPGQAVKVTISAGTPTEKP